MQPPLEVPPSYDPPADSKGGQLSRAPPPEPSTSSSGAPPTTSSRAVDAGGPPISFHVYKAGGMWSKDDIVTGDDKTTIQFVPTSSSERGGTEGLLADSTSTFRCSSLEDGTSRFGGEGNKVPTLRAYRRVGSRVISTLGWRTDGRRSWFALECSVKPTRWLGLMGGRGKSGRRTGSSVATGTVRRRHSFGFEMNVG